MLHFVLNFFFVAITSIVVFKEVGITTGDDSILNIAVGVLGVYCVRGLSALYKLGE